METIKDLVSIVTPSYNAAEFLPQLFNSILKQDYTPLEVILVDDGSTDDTASCIEHYRPLFDEKGIDFHYIYQKNQGQAAALNNGLKQVRGEFLLWPDADDYYFDHAISSRVAIMKAHPEVALVRCGAQFINEQGNKIVGYPAGEGKIETTIFRKVLFADHFLFAPIGMMLRMSSFLAINPKREIYAGRGGQNWQMLLPVVYSYPTFYANQTDCCYLVREQSHSHDINEYHQFKKRKDEHHAILFATLDQVPCSNKEREQLKQEVEYDLNRKLFIAGISTCSFDELFQQVDRQHLRELKYRIYYSIFKNRLVQQLYKMVKSKR